MTTLRRRAVAGLGAMATIAAVTACGSAPGKSQQPGKASPAAQVVCAKDAAGRSVALPKGFPAHFPLPPGTIVTTAADRGSAGLVVTGVTHVAFREVLRALQTDLPAKGFRPEDGESEPHDAESDWSSSDYEGRWSIREIPQCAGDTEIGVVARHS